MRFDHLAVPVSDVRGVMRWFQSIHPDIEVLYSDEEWCFLRIGETKLAFVHLSNGERYENPRELRRGAERLAQAQRGKRKKLAVRLQERQRNRRKDRNHKISRQIVENYAEIYITNDNLRGQAKMFGKSVGEASIGELRQKLLYKGRIVGRGVELIDSKYTTKTCSNCGSLSGPAGLGGLAVRQWDCKECGALHDRDINAARNILSAGLGWSLEISREASLQESSGGAR